MVDDGDDDDDEEHHDIDKTKHLNNFALRMP